MFSFLVLSWALTLGYVPTQSNIAGDQYTRIEQGKIATVSTIDFGVTAWNRLKIYSQIETFQYLNPTYTGFNPYRTDYIFGIDYYISKNITLGIIHECDHPVVSYYDMKADYQFLSSETKIFARIGSERK